jgi:hypothetical protein
MSKLLAMAANRRISDNVVETCYLTLLQHAPGLYDQAMTVLYLFRPSLAFHNVST